MILLLNLQFKHHAVIVHSVKKEGDKMTVNHSGTLNKEYFLAYLKLIMNTRECSLEMAKNPTLELFFHNNLTEYGEETSKRFFEAYNQLFSEQLIKKN